MSLCVYHSDVTDSSVPAAEVTGSLVLAAMTTVASVAAGDAPAVAAARSEVSPEGSHPPLDFVTTHASAGPPPPTGAARGPTGWGFVSLINRLDGTCSGGLSISSHDQGRMQAEEVRQAPIGIRAYYSSMLASMLLYS